MIPVSRIFYVLFFRFLGRRWGGGGGGGGRHELYYVMHMMRVSQILLNSQEHNIQFIQLIDTRYIGI